MKHGFTNFFGADLSQKLLDLVPNNLYKKLDKVDLNKPIEEKDDQYDALMCVGTFTFGHVKPPALDEFIRITKNKGLIVSLLMREYMRNMDLIKKLNN